MGENDQWDVRLRGAPDGRPRVLLPVERHNQKTVRRLGLGLFGPGFGLLHAVDRFGPQVQLGTHFCGCGLEFRGILLPRGLAVINRARPPHAVVLLAADESGFDGGTVFRRRPALPGGLDGRGPPGGSSRTARQQAASAHQRSAAQHLQKVPAVHTPASCLRTPIFSHRRPSWRRATRQITRYFSMTLFRIYTRDVAASSLSLTEPAVCITIFQNVALTAGFRVTSFSRSTCEVNDRQTRTERSSTAHRGLQV